jgi:hypothetical protein
MRRVRLSIPALLFLVAGSPLAAQVLTGVLLETDTRAPIEGALVSLLTDDRRVALSFTDARGAFALRAPRPGRYRVRAERIGFDTETSAEVEIPAVGRGGFEFLIATRAVHLDAIEVTGDARCGRRDDGSEVARVWDEARKALDAVALTESAGMVRLAVVSWKRDIDAATGAPSNERRQVRSARSRIPLRSLPPDDLADAGYVRSDETGIDWYAPDAEVLLSDSFQATHCFSLREDADQPSRIGLAFRPLRPTGAPDIEGTMWLDRESAEIRELDYRYARLPWRVWDQSIGGRVSFQRLGGGPWIVSDWHVRMPILVRAMERAVDVRISGFLEEGDEVLDVRSIERITAADGVVATAPAPAEPTLDGRGVATTTTPDSAAPSSPPVGAADRDSIAAGVAATAADTVVDLPGIRVEAEGRSPPLARVGFYERMEATRGRFLTRDDIERRRPSLASHAIENLPGIRTRSSRNDGMLVWFAGNEKATLAGIQICGPRLLINGVEVHKGGDGALLPIDRYVSVHEISGIEIYRSAAQLPPQYGGAHAACGVILIWTL